MGSILPPHPSMSKFSAIFPAYTTKTCSSPEEASNTSVAITGSLRSFGLFFLIVVLIVFSLSQACNDSGVSCFYKTSAPSPPETQLLLCSANQARSKPCPMSCSLLAGACSSVPMQLGRQRCRATDRMLTVTSEHFYSSYSARCSFPGTDTESTPGSESAKPLPAQHHSPKACSVLARESQQWYKNLLDQCQYKLKLQGKKRAILESFCTSDSRITSGPS